MKSLICFSVFRSGKCIVNVNTRTHISYTETLTFKSIYRSCFGIERSAGHAICDKVTARLSHYDKHTMKRNFNVSLVRHNAAIKAFSTRKLVVYEQQGNEDTLVN